MPKKTKYEVAGAKREDFEDLLESQRKELPVGSLVEGVWLLVKYSENATGYTAKELADYFHVSNSQLRSACTNLNKRGYFVSFVVEGTNKGKYNAAGVLRDVFSSDEAWETAWGRRLRNFLLPHMQRIAKFGELTAFARPQMLQHVASTMIEANNEWSDTRKKLALSVKAGK